MKSEKILICFNYLGAWKWVCSGGGLRCVVTASPKVWFELLSSMIIVPPAVEVVMMSGVVLFSLFGSKEIRMNRVTYADKRTDVCSRPLCTYSGIFSPKKKTGFSEIKFFSKIFFEKF